MEEEIGGKGEVRMNGGVGKEGRIEWKGKEVGKRTRMEGKEKVRGKGRERKGRKGGG